MSHNHPTRDIKPYGKCPGCDRHHIDQMEKILHDFMKVNGRHFTYMIAEDLPALFQVVEKLGLNMYVSYLPSKKKYRARVWEYFKIPHNEKQSEYIYDKTPALALARALVKTIRETQ